jgi:hypothetical protein
LRRRIDRTPVVAHGPRLPSNVPGIQDERATGVHE